MMDSLGPDKSIRVGRDGYTLMELLVVMSLIGVLVTLLLQSTEGVRRRVEKARCIGNLRALHTAVGAYIQDHQSWPKGSVGLSGKPFEQWWIDKLEPYTGTADVWICPTMRREEGALPEKDRSLISYTPGEAGANQFAPYRYPKQPWFIEIGAFHGGGNLILFPDGSVLSIEDAFGVNLDVN